MSDPVTEDLVSSSRRIKNKRKINDRRNRSVAFCLPDEKYSPIRFRIMFLASELVTFDNWSQWNSEFFSSRDRSKIKVTFSRTRKNDNESMTFLFNGFYLEKDAVG